MNYKKIKVNKNKLSNSQIMNKINNMNNKIFKNKINRKFKINIIKIKKIKMIMIMRQLINKEK